MRNEEKESLLAKELDVYKDNEWQQKLLVAASGLDDTLTTSLKSFQTKTKESI